MIKYALICDDGHSFDGWFGSSTDFDEQSERKLLSCPVCDSLVVTKSLMAPALQGTRKDGVTHQPHALTPDQASQKVTFSPSDPEQVKYIDVLRKMKKALLDNADDVGEDFAEEARKIHYGEVEERGIYGSAVPDDIAELVEEGIEIMPFPILPEDCN